MRFCLTILAAFLILCGAARAENLDPDATILQMENLQRLTLAADCLRPIPGEVGPEQLTRVEVLDPQVKVFNGHTAIVTGTWEIEAMQDGCSVQTSRRFTHLWVQVDGEWRLISHHLAMD